MSVSKSQSQKPSLLTRKFGFTFKVSHAPIVELVPAIYASYSSVDKTIPFGKALVQHIEKPLMDLLRDCDRLYNDHYVNKPGTSEFALFADVFLSPFWSYVPWNGQDTYIGKAQLVLLLNSLLTKLRESYKYVRRLPNHGEYSSSLLEGLENLLKKVPEQVQHDKPSKDGTPIYIEKMFITFVDAFRLAANEQRHFSASKIEQSQPSQVPKDSAHSGQSKASKPPKPTPKPLPRIPMGKQYQYHPPASEQEPEEPQEHQSKSKVQSQKQSQQSQQPQHPQSKSEWVKVVRKGKIVPDIQDEQ